MLTNEITNERECRIAKAEAEGLERQIARQRDETAGLEPELRAAMEQASVSRLSELHARICWYENLRRSGGAVLQLESLGDLPETLIQARIAGGLTQKQLAARLGVREQQVQKDEQTRYANAKFERLVEIAGVLGVHFAIRAVLPSAADQNSGQLQVVSGR